MEKLKNSGIYMILNTVNMKVYIGSSVNLVKRKREHYNSLEENKHYNPHLQKSYNKYGKDKFIFVVLERNIERKDLYIRENFHIKEKESLNQSKGYNMAIPSKDDNMVLRPKTIELKRRKAYIQYYGEITDEALYEDWKNNKDNPVLLTKEEIQATARERFGKSLYGICQKTNKILVEYDSVQAAMDALHNGVRQRIDKEGRFVAKMAIVSKENYDPTKDYTKKYAQKYIKKGIFKGKPIETYDPITLKTIKKYENKKIMAKMLGTTENYIGKVVRREKGKGLYKGVGIRWT